MSRNRVAFWILGLTNNLGYVVMLSAAHDILATFPSAPEHSAHYIRPCNSMSTGIILLADIMPSILVKIVSPFLPLMIKLRMCVTILLSAVGFVLVSYGRAEWTVLLGVVSTSLSCGLGESSLLAYVVSFKTTDVLSTWSSGTGGAGVLGSLCYAALTSAGLAPQTTIFLMLVSPLLQAVSFFILLQHPSKKVGTDDDPDPELLSFRDRLKILPRLLAVYMLPFGLVYLCEYTINQGFFELLYFPNDFLGHSEQYRWYSVLYQIGVFISRSSMGLLKVHNVWLLAFLQFVNVLLCLGEVVYGYVGFLPLMMGLILWEGMVGGASYVNTYRRIATELPPEARQFSMAMNSFADVLMISCAGLLSYPLHGFICSKFPSPYS